MECVLAGRIRMHEFKRTPRFPRCLVGNVASEDWKAMAERYCSTYPTGLNLAQNDCKTFSLQLVRTLTSVEMCNLQELEMVTPSKSGADDSQTVPGLLDWN